MSYLALYRKYRPNSFDSVYGQDEIVTVLKNAIANNRISHAYLFSGPRGTGKTTTAKIIARLVNCENLGKDGNPCGKCYSCINYLNSNDIVEIDAASNNGVDEIRDLRDKVNLVPSNSKYKVYIIDEVHMLTNQAFNALLKTLEEPPSHVIFILATTEPHKIPLTISSRCQKFQFSKIDVERIVVRLKEIANAEKINIRDDALYEIAVLSDGGMRDAINFLDQLISYSSSEITLNDIYKVNGSVSYSDIYTLFSYVRNNEKIKIIEFFDNFDKCGKEVNKFVEELIIFLKDVLVYKNTNFINTISEKNDSIKKTNDLFESKDIYAFIEVLNDVENRIKFSTHGTIIFMTFVLKFSDRFIKNETKVDINVNDEKNISREINSNAKIEKKEINSTDFDNNCLLSNNEKMLRINNALATASKDILKSIKNKWNCLDDYMYDDEFAMVCGLLKDSIPVVASDKYIMIDNKLSSVIDRINSNCELIEKLFSKLFGYKVFIVGISEEEWIKEKEKYIKNIKNGIKYVVKENIDNDNNNNNNNKVDNSKTAVDDLIDLVGDTVIEYK